MKHIKAIKVSEMIAIPDVILMGANFVMYPKTSESQLETKERMGLPLLKCIRIYSQLLIFKNNLNLPQWTANSMDNNNIYTI